MNEDPSQCTDNRHHFDGSPERLLYPFQLFGTIVITGNGHVSLGGSHDWHKKNHNEPVVDAHDSQGKGAVTGQQAVG